MREGVTGEEGLFMKSNDKESFQFFHPTFFAD